MKSNNQENASLVTDSLLNKEAYFSVVVFWTLLTLRNIWVHGLLHFQFDASIFFELCFFLVPTAFISSKKIIKNTNAKIIFNKHVTRFLILMCIIFVGSGISLIAISNHYITTLGSFMLIVSPIINHIALLLIIFGLFNFWVTLQVKYLANETI